MMRCAYAYPEGKCLSSLADHVHQPLPCDNGKPERHHDFTPEPPHEHRFDRCLCGLTADKVPAGVAA